MKKTKNSEAGWLKNRNLISLRRSKVDGNGIQGFLVGLSDELLALEYVYDFQVDGLMILRRSDVTETRRTGTDEFQEELLKREGIRAGTQRPAPLELDSWKSAVQQLAAHYPLLILERELGPSPEFFIGRVTGTSAAQLEFQTFTGTGRWAKAPERLKYKQITSMQANTRYVNFYQRHFDRDGS